MGFQINWSIILLLFGSRYVVRVKCALDSGFEDDVKITGRFFLNKFI